MRIFKTSFVAVFCAMIGSTALAETFNLNTDTWVQGAYFKSGTVLKTFDQSGPTLPESGILARPYTSGEITWAPDRSIRFDNRMAVMDGIVSAGNLAGLALTPGSVLSFHPNGSPSYAVLAKPRNLSNYGVDVPGVTAISLYANGSIRAASLGGVFAFSAKSDGRLFLLAPGVTQFWPTGAESNALFLAGTVKQGTLSVAHAYKLDIFPANSIVGFDGAGELSSLRCPITCTYKRIVLNGGGSIELIPAGSFTLIGNQPVTIGTKTYPAGQQLLVTAEGTVISASTPQL